MMLRGHTFQTFNAQPLSTDCREACNSDVRCQSYNYVFFKDICELNNRTKEARPEDFVKDNDIYYMTKAPNRVAYYAPFSDEKDWNHANASCKADGAQLVKIESADKNDFIKSLLGEGYYWIGLTDAETEGDWKWSDGSNFTGYANWISGDPNNYNNEDCVGILKGGGFDGGW
ncbi:hypothetical protein ACROYT_G027300 [Oculina patagonica]